MAEDIYVGGPNYRACAFNRLARAGVGVVRQAFRWSEIESSPGSFNTGYYDDYVAAAAQHGITILPILFEPPSFRAKKGKRRGIYPPRRNADFGRFAALLARRYGPGGSLWRSRPLLSPRPIRAWQIWNEPNLSFYWPTGPNAREYAAMLKATARAIRSVDRGAEIVSAGLPFSKIGVPFERYVGALYRAGAARWFDTLATNPYSTSSRGVLLRVRAARRAMRRAGDRSGRLWVTEFGWASGGPRSSFRVGAKGQAARIDATLRTLHRHRRALRLRGLVYFNLKDSAPYPGGKDFWGLHTGLLGRDGEEKPAFGSFAAAGRSLR